MRAGTQVVATVARATLVVLDSLLLRDELPIVTDTCVRYALKGIVAKIESFVARCALIILGSQDLRS